ncbi:MAG: chloride channel protein [Oscillibacter sp.]|nr:chloride channel protein [Oscillibacter sp.]
MDIKKPQGRDAEALIRNLTPRLLFAGRYLLAFLRWIPLAAVIGALSGAVGSAFHHSVDSATAWRNAAPWLLYGLPFAGLAIVGIYKASGTEGQGTNDVLDEIHIGRGLSLRLLPSIFMSTFLTHLCGGSSGREGAALQMGGVIGYHTAKLFRLDDRDQRTATAAGMAAFFTALFGTPMAATVFALTVVSVGRYYSADLLPCLTASLSAYGCSLLLAVEPTRFSVAAPELNPLTLFRVLLFAAVCALVSVLFCETIHATEHLLQKRLPNPWVRALAGGAVLIALTLLSGTRDYNGAGMDVITAAVERGAARPEAFLLKILFTALTLGASFKGGEVVPSFFVGATFGAVFGPLCGIPATFAAAVGLVSVFCGATNTPLASVFLAVELFGDGGLLYYAVACVTSYALSGYSGLYNSQTILYSKMKARYINARTNAHRIGEDGELDRDA